MAYPARSWTAYHWPSLHLRGSTMQRSKIKSAPLLQMSAAYSGTMTQHASVCVALVSVITGFTTGFTCNFVRIRMRLSKLHYLMVYYLVNGMAWVDVVGTWAATARCVSSMLRRQMSTSGSMGVKPNCGTCLRVACCIFLTSVASFLQVLRLASSWLPHTCLTSLPLLQVLHLFLRTARCIKRV